MIRSNFISVSGENWKAEQDRKRIERERIIELPKRERKQANYNLKMLFKSKIDYRPKIRSKIISKPKIQIKKTPPMDELKKALSAKIASYKYPKLLRISSRLVEPYKLDWSKNSEKENRFLLLELNELGMDTENVYDKIKQSIQDLSNQKLPINSIHRFGSSDHDVFR